MHNKLSNSFNFVRYRNQLLFQEEIYQTINQYDRYCFTTINKKKI